MFQIVISEYKSETFGKNLQIKVFDCEHEISRGSIIRNLFEESHTTTYKEYSLAENLRDIDLFIFPRTNIYYKLARLKQFILLNPASGNCGLSIRLLPLDSQTDHFEITLGLGTFNKTGKEPCTEEDYPGIDDCLTPAEKQARFMVRPIYKFYTNVYVKSADNLTISSYEGQWGFMYNHTQHEINLEVNITKKEYEMEKYKTNFNITLRDHDNYRGFEANFTLGIEENGTYGAVKTNLNTMYSDEQKLIMAGNISKGYLECETERFIKNISTPISRSCAKAATGLRQITLKTSIEGVRNSLIKRYLDKVLYLGYQYMKYVPGANDWNNNFTSAMNNLVQSNDVKYDITFPLIPNELNVIAQTKEYITSFIGIPSEWDSWYTEYLSPWQILFVDVYVSNIFSTKAPVVCVVGDGIMVNANLTIVNSSVPNDWTTYIKKVDSENDFQISKYQIDLKQENGVMVSFCYKKNSLPPSLSLIRDESTYDGTAR